MTINALASMIALLRADTEVAAAVGSVTVYGQTLAAITGEIDDEWAKLMKPPQSSGARYERRAGSPRPKLVP